MNLVCVTPSTDLIFTLEELRAHLNSLAEDDAYVTLLAKAAQGHTQTVLNARFGPEVWKQTYPDFPSYFETELRPIRKIDHIKYYDRNDQLKELTEYRLDDVAEHWLILPATSSTSWPDVSIDRLNAVELQYEAGYADATDVPDELKVAIMFLIGHWFTNREAITISPGEVAVEVPKTFDWLIHPFKEYRF